MGNPGDLPKLREMVVNWSELEAALEVPSCSRRQIDFPDDADAKSVRDAAFAAFQEKGLIPAVAKVGWLSNPGRRKDCTSLENDYLDRINALFTRAKEHYGTPRLRQPKTFVSYVRVSTRGQGRSGLGMEGQAQTIIHHIRKVRGTLLREYREVRSGRDDRRPQLMEAITLVQATGATLIVARLDRLSRDAYFILGLQKEGVRFVVAECPDAPPRFIAHMAVDAQYDLENSQSTKAALALSQKPKGVKALENLSKNPGSMAQGRELGTAAMRDKADLFAKKMEPIIKRYQDDGLNQAQIAQKLNENRVLTATGKHGSWTSQTVRNVVVRAEQVQRHMDSNILVGMKG